MSDKNLEQIMIREAFEEAYKRDIKIMIPKKDKSIRKSHSFLKLKLSSLSSSEVTCSSGNNEGGNSADSGGSGSGGEEGDDESDPGGDNPPYPTNIIHQTFIFINSVSQKTEPISKEFSKTIIQELTKFLFKIITAGSFWFGLAMLFHKWGIL